MSQTDLGRALKVSTHQIQRYEAGVNSVGAGLLYCIARVLNVEIGFFFDGIGLDEAPEN